MPFHHDSIFRKTPFLLPVSIMFVCAWIVLGTTFIQKGLFKIFLHHIEDRSGMELRIEDHSWDTPGQVSLYGVEAYDEGRLLANAPTITIVYRILLEDMALHIREIRLESPVVRVWKDRHDEWELPAGNHSTTDNGDHSRFIFKILWDQCRMTVISGVMIGLDDSGREMFRSRLSGELSVHRLFAGKRYRKLFQSITLPEGLTR